jgi:signal transduction histidine kinase
MRPLDRVGSIKLKLGLVIVATVALTVVSLYVGRRAGLSVELRIVVAAAIGLLMVQGLARGMTSPLREMAAAASAMARGEHGIRVTATSRDEVGALARAFNAMTADLADAERQRRDLVANVSHELRTPIGALQALLENLADGVEPPDPATLRVALAQTERLGRLVAQLLDLSRLEAGAVPLRPRSFSVRPLLEQVTRECALSDDRPVRLKVTVQPGDLRLLGDPERVHQVVANLLDNAVRHSPPGGCVWLSAHRGDTPHEMRNSYGVSPLVVIEVADEGPGIPEHDAQRVFERFQRLDSSRAANTGGTGLGLSIARWIVDAHGGTIRAERREPAGCRMVVELPA